MVVTTNCETGKPEYFELNGKSTSEFKTILAASSSLPFISPIVHYDNKLLMDGGISDSIPFEYALKNGSERAVLILTQPKDYIKGTLKLASLFKWHFRKHPLMFELMKNRYKKYNADLKKIEELEKSGQVFVIRPEQAIEVSRIENKPEKTALAYEKARIQAEEEVHRLMEWL